MEKSAAHSRAIVEMCDQDSDEEIFSPQKLSKLKDQMDAVAQEDLAGTLNMFISGATDKEIKQEKKAEVQNEKE